jgi:hypothetical protein
VLDKVYKYFVGHPNVSAEEGNEKAKPTDEEEAKPTDEALAKWNKEFLKDIEQPELFELILVRPCSFLSPLI